MLDTINLLGILAGLVIPVFNGLVTRYSSARARVYLQLVLNAAAGLVAEALSAANAGTAYDWKAAGIASGLTLLVALATEAGVYSPLGVSDWAKRSLRKDDVALAG